MKSIIHCKNSEYTLINSEGKTRWKPEIKDRYWYLDSIGSVLLDVRVLLDDDDEENAFFIHRYRLGNVFRTKEEAAKARDKQILLVKLHDYADECNKKLMFCEYRFYYICDSLEYGWMACGLTSAQYYMPGFLRIEDARSAIRYFGADRLNLLRSKT